MSLIERRKEAYERIQEQRQAVKTAKSEVSEALWAVTRVKYELEYLNTTVFDDFDYDVHYMGEVEKHLEATLKRLEDAGVGLLIQSQMISAFIRDKYNKSPEEL